jgi:putrescine transport system permease protein
VLGTLAALALTRYTRFRGRLLFSGMVYAPLVMPEVITGLSLLLLFVAIGFDRGFVTVTLAHITFTMCFVAVVVQSRLLSFDRSLEEAAMDLGATPVKTFLEVTLPVIAPACCRAGCWPSPCRSTTSSSRASPPVPGATTLPMKIYSQVRLGVTPEINAACTLLIGFVAASASSSRLDHDEAARSAAPSGTSRRPSPAADICQETTGGASAPSGWKSARSPVPARSRRRRS